MLKLNKKNIINIIRYYSKEKLQNTKIKYTDTINLPKTKFPLRLSAAKRLDIENKILNTCFNDLYSWQYDNLRLPEFILHDGPPYANGDLHMGHAINKILKDIILRHYISMGQKVNYIPGWDCHGLPIELKAVKNQNKKIEPLQLRKIARTFALETLEKQKEAFKRWGVTGDWNNSQNLYKTIDKCYIKNELKLFLELYKKNYIYRVLKPVYWSPSTRTALAEAELEYDNNYESLSAFIRFKVKSIGNKNFIKYKNLYGLIWTTTPWTIPSNQAICYNCDLNYSIIKLKNNSNEMYIVATELINSISQSLGIEIEIIYDNFNGDLLKGITYAHPFHADIELPFLNGNHVQATKGTGLVHTAPAHGPDDFITSLEYKIPVQCIVDEKGDYTPESPEFLIGKNVIKDGNQLVIQKLGLNVLKTEKIIHSYPIDWRTKEPVIFRASMQWFINTELIKESASKLLNEIKFYPKKSSEINQQNLLNQVLKRPYWCISRQRSWGVPIPVFYDKKTGETIVNAEIIENICKELDKNDNIDFWWDENLIENIITKDICEKYQLKQDNLEKGNDIFDIWFDSGISWFNVLKENKVADLYLEGKDQCTGWFQTSMLTSVAMRNKLPYKSVFVHGFAVDENGYKMSKSLGNVISPKDLINIYGMDTLRWWVASHATQHTNIEVSKNLMESSNESVQKIRSILKYVLGIVERSIPKTDYIAINELQLKTLDKSILYAIYQFDKQAVELYNTYQFNRVTALLLNFLTNDLSASYLHLIKDRLYCDTTENYQNLKKIFEIIFMVLCKHLYPIAPFLIEECWNYCDSKPFYKIQQISLSKFSEYEDSFMLLQKIKTLCDLVNQNSSGRNTINLKAEIHCNKENFNLIQKLHPFTNDFRSDSELCELLQVSSIKLFENFTLNDFSVNLIENIKTLCPRCRRFSLDDDENVCIRCDLVLKEKNISI